MKKHLFSLLLIATLMMSYAGCSTIGDFFASLKGSPPDVEKDWETGTRTGSQKNDEGKDNNSAQNPTSIVGHEWKLIEVYINGTNTRFNRSTLPEEPGNFFTLNFDAQNVSGVGVPNLYSAPYTYSERTINIMLIRATMMASFFEPENLTEQNFFYYLQNAHSWKLTNNNLELLSNTQTGGEVRLVFSL